MDETTNQSTESTELFAIDEVANDTPDASDAITETTTAEPVEEPFMTIRYNGADENLTRDEAITLAQKGRNYDKINERLTALQNDPFRKQLDEIAMNAGLSTEEYMNRLSEFQTQSSIQRIAREFKRQNPDATDEIASQYAQQAYENQQTKLRKDKADKAKADADAEQNALVEEVKAFNKAFPKVDLNTLPQEVIDDINSGTPLMQAYLMYDNRQLRSRMQSEVTNQNNAKRNIGKLNENSGSANGGDPFLSGLLGG